MGCDRSGGEVYTVIPMVGGQSNGDGGGEI